MNKKLKAGTPFICLREKKIVRSFLVRIIIPALLCGTWWLPGLQVLFMNGPSDSHRPYHIDILSVVILCWDYSRFVGDCNCYLYSRYSRIKCGVSYEDMKANSDLATRHMIDDTSTHNCRIRNPTNPNVLLLYTVEVPSMSLLYPALVL